MHSLTNKIIGLKAITEYCKGVKSLHLLYVNGDFEYLSPNMSQLQELSLNNDRGNSLSSIAKYPLTYLNIE